MIATLLNATGLVNGLVNMKKRTCCSHRLHGLNRVGCAAGVSCEYINRVWGCANILVCHESKIDKLCSTAFEL